MLPAAPAELKKRVARTRIGNGFGMIVRHAVEELPDYGDASAPAGPLPGTRDYQTSLQLLCPSVDYLTSSHRDFMFGLPPGKPSVVAMSFSSLDPTLAPPGKHVLFTWGQYHPYELSNGEDWDSIREREADKLYDLVCQYAPNMRGKMIDRYIQTPLDIERTLGLLRANVMHLEMSLDQMFMFRPAAGAFRVQGARPTGPVPHRRQHAPRRRRLRGQRLQHGACHSGGETVESLQIGPVAHADVGAEINVTLGGAGIDNVGKDQGDYGLGHQTEILRTGISREGRNNSGVPRRQKVA